jgi:hypothetical protein
LPSEVELQVSFQTVSLKGPVAQHTYTQVHHIHPRTCTGLFLFAPPQLPLFLVQFHFSFFLPVQVHLWAWPSPDEGELIQSWEGVAMVKSRAANFTEWLDASGEVITKFMHTRTHMDVTI